MVKTGIRFGILLTTLVLWTACTSGYLTDSPNMRLDFAESRRLVDLSEDDYLELRIFSSRDIYVERDDLTGTSYRITGDPLDLRGQSVFRIPLRSSDEETEVSIPHVPVGPQYRILVLNNNARFGAVSSAFRMTSNGVTTVRLGLDRITDLDNPSGPGADLVLEADSPEDIASVFESSSLLVYELLGLTIDASGLGGNQYEWLIDGASVTDTNNFDFHTSVDGSLGFSGLEFLLTLRVEIDGLWYSDSTMVRVTTGFEAVQPEFAAVLEFSSGYEDVILSWSEVPGAAHYNVWVNIYHDDNHSWFDITEITDTFVVLERLPAGAEFRVFLDAESAEGRLTGYPELWFYSEYVGGEKL